MATTDSYSSGRSASPESIGDQSDQGAGETITLQFIANSREVGSIIGKGGENVKKVREQSGSRVSISNSSAPERVVTIIGTTPEVVRAFSMICTKFEMEGQSCQPHSSIPSITFRLIVPNNHCGSLIGKSGNNIKELREVTGATVQVANDMIPNSNERVVTISGSTDSVMQCIVRLCTIAAETSLKGPVVPYPTQKSPYWPGVFDGQYVLPGARNHMQPQQMVMTEQQLHVRMTDEVSSFCSNQNAMSGILGGRSSRGGGTRTQELIIPNHMIGSIIGKQGSRINGIRQCSQAIIKIADLEEGSTNRKVTITGTPTSIDSALYLIRDVQARYGSSAKRL